MKTTCRRVFGAKAISTTAGLCMAWPSTAMSVTEMGEGPRLPRSDVSLPSDPDGRNLALELELPDWGAGQFCKVDRGLQLERALKVEKIGKYGKFHRAFLYRR